MMNLETINEKEFFPGVFGRFVHGEKLSWAFWRVEKGAEVPLHHHVHEQMMHVVSGEFQFELDGKSTICKTGDIVVIPSNVPHFGKALTDCQLMDVFTPARDEYR
jgi:quercetin dioxygenase-like cupin family protein